jgi:membrane protein DedA with SNARE-associated domain
MDPRRQAHPHALHFRIGGAIAGVLVTLLVGGLGVAVVFLAMQGAAFGLQWLLVLLLMMGESAAVHLPSEVILPLGGWLIVRDHGLGLAGVLALSGLAALGNVLGSLAIYAMGKVGGRALVRRWGRYVMLHEEDIDGAERRMRAHRYRALFASRVLPVVRTYGGFVAGLLDIPLWPFVLITFAGSLAWSAAFVAAGVLLGSNWDIIRGPAEIVGLTTLGVLVAAVVATTLRQARVAGRE